MNKTNPKDGKKISVNSACIGCGICASIAPDVFEMDNETGMSVVKDGAFSEEDLTKAKEAQEACPTGAIEIGE